MRYRYLIWHFDGALFDTTAALLQATTHALAAHERALPPEALAALLVEAGGAVGARAARRCGLPAAAFQAVWASAYRAILLRDQPPQPGAVALCRRVAEAGGHNYLYAARSHRAVDRFLAAFGLTPLFTGWLTADDAAPTAGTIPDFRLLLSGCGLPARATLLITNRPADVQAAGRAGLAACFFGPSPPPAATCAVTAYETLAGTVFAAPEVVS